MTPVPRFHWIGATMHLESYRCLSQRFATRRRGARASPAAGPAILLHLWAGTRRSAFHRVLYWSGRTMLPATVRAVPHPAAPLPSDAPPR